MNNSDHPQVIRYLQMEILIIKTSFSHEYHANFLITNNSFHNFLLINNILFMYEQQIVFASLRQKADVFGHEQQIFSYVASFVVDHFVQSPRLIAI
jgi:hypothetical protein